MINKVISCALGVFLNAARANGSMNELSCLSTSPSPCTCQEYDSFQCLCLSVIAGSIETIIKHTPLASCEYDAFTSSFHIYLRDYIFLSTLEVAHLVFHTYLLYEKNTESQRGWWFSQSHPGSLWKSVECTLSLLISGLLLFLVYFLSTSFKFSFKN